MSETYEERRIKYAKMRIRRLKEKIHNLDGFLNETKPDQLKATKKAIRSSKTAIIRWEKIIKELEANHDNNQTGHSAA
jgi:flagellin-specific chaperone FliS